MFQLFRMTNEKMVTEIKLAYKILQDTPTTGYTLETVTVWLGLGDKITWLVYRCAVKRVFPVGKLCNLPE